MLASPVIRAGPPVRFAAAVGAAVALSLPASAFARDWRGPIDAPRVAIQGGHAAGPASYDRLWVRKYGPKDPRCVMVAVPGSPAGQGGFGWIAHAIAARVPRLAVWAVDRRPNAFEDVSSFKSGTPSQALGYYLGGQPFDGKQFQPVQPDQAGFVRKWGASVALRDLRHVIREARAGGRRCVILTGHSFGALMVPSYAAWDFSGHPGFRSIDAMVLIDGGMFNAFGTLLPQSGFPPFKSVGQARRRIDALQTQTPFGSDESMPGVPEWLTGVVPEVVCRFALARPNAPSTLQAEGLDSFLPHPPSFPVTNAGFAGLFNNQVLADQGARLGQLSASGSPRSWDDGPRASVRRFCATFTQEPGNGLEWYFPIRLEIDLAQGMQSMVPTPITRFLGLRPFHLQQIDVPLYAIETRLSHGKVLRAAHKLIDRSRISDYRLVRADRMKHYDPLMSLPRHNRFLHTVVPFLRGVVRKHS